jgi:hypothetical protein
MEVWECDILLKYKAPGHILPQFWHQILFTHVHIRNACHSRLRLVDDVRVHFP